MVGVVSRREQLLRALSRFEWAQAHELADALGVSRTNRTGVWHAIQKLVADALVECDESVLPRYRITHEGLLEHARLKAKREAELLAF